MTKKDYIMLAKLVNSHLLYVSVKNVPEFIQNLVKELKKDNPRFDEVKFKKACGIIN